MNSGRIGLMMLMREIDGKCARRIAVHAGLAENMTTMPSLVIEISVRSRDALVAENRFAAASILRLLTANPGQREARSCTQLPRKL